MRSYCSIYRKLGTISYTFCILKQTDLDYLSFTGNVKLKGLIVIGGENGSHPSKVRL